MENDARQKRVAADSGIEKCNADIFPAAVGHDLSDSPLFSGAGKIGSRKAWTRPKQFSISQTVAPASAISRK